MKTRTQKRIEEAPAPRKLAAVPQPEVLFKKIPKPKGGRRPGAGRPAYLKPEERKEESVYVSMTTLEKAKYQAQADKRGITISFVIRQELGLPI
jgi:hypothetical protein